MEKLQILDFHAKWCGPCNMLMPIIDQISNQYKEDDRVLIEKIDVDEQSDIAKKYSIKTIPTILFIKNDEVLHKINGATSKKNILEKIEELI